MFPSSFTRALAASIAAVASAAALAQAGQSQSSVVSGPSLNSADAPALTYRSVFEGYQPFADEKIIGWKQANETVREIGGWRAYAKESRQTESGASGQPQAPQASPQSPVKPQPAQAPASGGSNPHGGHGK